MKKLILASTSPRRQELLRALRIPFEAVAPECDESHPEGMAGADIPLFLAEKKVASVRESLRGRKLPVVGADTAVLLGGAVLGKPQSRAEAEGFLRALSGKRHSVVSGVALFDPATGRASAVRAETDVFFKELSDGEMSWYLGTGEWMGAAGGYRIQERGAFFVRKIVGSHSNVVGLPLSELYDMLCAHGFMSGAEPL